MDWAQREWGQGWALSVKVPHASKLLGLHTPHRGCPLLPGTAVRSGPALASARCLASQMLARGCLAGQTRSHARMHAPRCMPAAAAARARPTRAWGAGVASQPYSDDSQGLYEASQGNLTNVSELPRGPFNDMHCSGSSMEERAWREANRQHPGTMQVTLQAGLELQQQALGPLLPRPVAVAGGSRRTFQGALCVLDRPPARGNIPVYAAPVHDAVKVQWSGLPHCFASR